jgi:hypothetical protein
MDNIIIGQRYTIYLKSHNILRGNVFKITDKMLILINVNKEINKKTQWCITIDSIIQYENLITITKNKLNLSNDILLKIDQYI